MEINNFYCNYLLLFIYKNESKVDGAHHDARRLVDGDAPSRPADSHFGKYDLLRCHGSQRDPT